VAGEADGVTSDIPDPLRELARRQAGVVSTQQVLAAGLTRAALKWQLNSSRWQQLRHGVYALFSGQPSREAVMWAAVLRAGPGAILSHQTAAELHRLIDKPSGALHLTLPASRRLRPVPGLVIHTSIYAAQIRHPSLSPPRTRVEDTVLDLIGVSDTFDDACGWVTRACGRRLTTEERLRAAMAARSRLRWRQSLTPVLADAAGGVHSVLEFRYYRDVERAHCLPRAIRQVRVVNGRRTAYRDAFYPRYRVVVELDGRLAHPGDARWRDIRRDNAAAADGGITLRYGWSDVTANPCRTAGELARVMVQRGWVGLPKLCSADCAVVAGWV
jgi:predicted transcriptional regulator of viral defense system